MSPPPLRPPTTTAPLTTTTAAAVSTSTSSPAAAFSLYSHPQLYDAAFAFRDFDAEAQFLVVLRLQAGIEESLQKKGGLDGRHRVS